MIDIAALLGILWVIALYRAPAKAALSPGTTALYDAHMADISIKVRKRDRKPITFVIEGDEHVYKFTPPKNSYMMMPMLSQEDETDEERAMNLTRRVFDWLGVGLSEEDVKRVIARLEDPEDDLDVDFLGELTKEISEQVAGRPTT